MITHNTNIFMRVHTQQDRQSERTTQIKMFEDEIFYDIFCVIYNKGISDPKSNKREQVVRELLPPNSNVMTVTINK